MVIASPSYVRPLEPRDPDAVSALYGRAMALEPNIGQVTAEQWRAFLARPQTDGGKDFRVAVAEEQLIGLAESTLRDQGSQRVRLVKIVVDPDERRRGVGSALLDAVLAPRPAEESLILQALAYPSWEAGHAFLARYGFAQAETESTMTCGALRPLPFDPPDGLALARPADTSAEARAVVRIRDAAFAGDISFRPHTVEEMQKRFSAEELWTAALAGETLAYALIDASERWLEEIAVAPTHQGQGIGATLVAASLRAQGIDLTHPAGLNVSSANPRAFRLYERLGFTTRSEKLRFAAQRTEVLARIRSRKVR